MKRLIAAAILLVPCVLGPVSCASTPSQEDNICNAWNVWSPEEREVFIGNIWGKVVPNVMTSMEQFDLTDGQMTAIRECLVGEKGPLVQDVTTGCAKPGAYLDSSKIGDIAGARSGACVEKVL
jgi:hypothetical protein